MKRLARFEVVGLDSHEADLEDVFLALYRERRAVPGSVVRKTLRDVRRSFIWWSAGLVGLVGMIVAAWPTVRDNPALKRLHETFPKELQAFVSFGGEFDYSTPAGYLGSELFSFMVPLLLLVAAIGAGAGALAGEEERGTLDLLLANPISRVRLAAREVRWRSPSRRPGSPRCFWSLW